MFDPDGLIDISLPIQPGMLLFPGDSPPAIRRLSSLDAGDPLTTSEVLLGCHVGTHVDAPAHFISGGLEVAELDLKHFMGPAVVIEIPHSRRIVPDNLAAISLPKKHHLLLKTMNSELLRTNVANAEYAYLTPETVEYLLAFEPLSIGFDYYSLDPPSDSHFPAHLAVAKRSLPAFVCLNLADVKAGAYMFLAFIPRLLGIEGFSVRAFLSPLP